MRNDKREPGKLSELKFGLEAVVLTVFLVLLLTRCWGVSLLRDC